MKPKALLTLTLLMQGSCASLFSGTTQKVAIHSEPPGAKIFVDEIYYGDTPKVVDVRRSLEMKQLTLRKDGYADTQTLLKARFNPVTLINLVEPIGWVVDALTGAIAKYDNSVHVELGEPVGGGPTASAPPVQVVPSTTTAVTATQLRRTGQQAGRR